MANYATLKAAIDQVVKANGQQDITGPVMNQVLKAIVDGVGAGYNFAGVATPQTNPGSPDGSCFWIGGKGSYTNFGASTVNVLSGYLGIFMWDGSAFTSSVLKIGGSGGAFDVTDYTGQQYATLAAALAAVPVGERSGGMSIMYVDSTDGQYKQARFFLNTFTAAQFTNADNWQGVDDKPIAFSQNLVKSGGVKQELDKKVVIKCGKNLYNPDTNTPGYYISSDGGLRQNGSYSVTDYIPVTAGDYHLSERDGQPINTVFTYINLYDAEYNKLYTIVGGSVDLTIPNGISYMRVTVLSAALDIQIEMGDTRTSYEPYSPIWGYTTNIPDSSITENKLADNSIGTTKLKSSSVTGEKIAAKSVSLEKTDFAEIVNIVVPADIHNKQYHNNENYSTYKSNDIYIATGLIEIKPNTTYYFINFSNTGSGTSARYVEFFNSEKVRLEVQQYKNSWLSPNTAVYAIVTFTKAVSGSDTLDKIYVGERELSVYKPYKLQIPGSLIDTTTFDNESILTNALKNKCVTQEKLADNLHIDANPARFGVISSDMSSVAAGATLNTPFIRGYKNISLIVQIDSAFEEVKFGVDKDEFYQIAFILDSTNVKLVSGAASTEVWTEAHGLTFGSNTVALVTKNIDRDSAKITIFNEQGEYWEKSFIYGNLGGLPYLLNSGQSSITAKIGFELRDINEKIWLFGDSYFAYDGDNRWPYYLINAGFTRNLLSAKGGDVPNSALSSFINLLATGARPSFAVWCMGMNGIQDSGDTPNTSWLTPTTSFISICEEYGITPIISTIPTVPSLNHAARNAWVRSHSYRYIDFAFAVEVSGSDYWKNWGTAKAMLSSDEVHPTAYGAKALYQQVIRDFPEIMVTC